MPTFTGNAAPETITGSAADDFIYGYGGDDMLLGEDGADQLYGGANADLLLGGDGDDRLYGGTENDILIGGAGNDFLNGGTGIDWADFSGGAAVNADLLTNSSTGQGTDTLAQLENLRGSSFADVLRGNNAINIIEGGDGDDRLRLSQGADVLDGGLGQDLLDLSASQIALSVSMGASGSYAGVSGGPYQGSLTAIEDVLATAHSDVITTSGPVHVINAGLGVLDTITANGAADTLSFAGLQASNVVDLLHAPGTAFSGRATHHWGGSQIGADQFSGIENVIGGDYADIIRGDGGANVIDGGDGDDVIRASFGVDTLNGGNGIDTLSLDSTTGASVFLNADYYLLLNNDVGSVQGFENVTGSDFMDSLFGNYADNILSGGLADDFLYAGGGFQSGHDQLFGGGGADWLIAHGFTAVLTGDSDVGGPVVDNAADLFSIYTQHGTTRITDFMIGVDTLDLSNFSFAASPGAQAAHSGQSFYIGQDLWIAITTNAYNLVSNIILEGVGPGSGFSADDVINGFAGLVPVDPVTLAGGGYYLI